MSRAVVRWLSASGLALTLLCAAFQLAAQPLGVAEPATTPPLLKSDRGATFPEKALRARVTEIVSVDLVLEIDPEGQVTKATVTTPRGRGFDEAALAAARELRFQPATRAGRPVAARIRFRYTFTPPPAELVGRVVELQGSTPIAGATVAVRDASGNEIEVAAAADGTWTIHGLHPGPVRVRASHAGFVAEGASVTLGANEETTIVLRLRPVSADAEGAVEVLVQGTRPPREVTKRTLGREEIRHSAGTQGDALLSLSNLPGIARPPPFTGRLAVRGSAPADTLVFVDETDVPLVYHFGGLSSVVPTELLDGVDFYPGNFSARYGRAMGGLVNARLRPPKSDGYHLMGEVSVLGLRLLGEGPLGKDWSFVAAAQRSWLDLFLPALAALSGGEQTALPNWADYQAGIEKKLDDRSSFRLLFLGSDDGLNIINPTPFSRDPTLAGALTYHTNFWRAQARFDAEPFDGTRLHAVAAFGQDRLDQTLGTNLVDATLSPLSGRLEVSQRIVSSIRAHTGLDIVYQPYQYALQLPPPSRPGVPAGGPGEPPVRTSGSDSLFLPGMYSELEVNAWRGGHFVPGIRADYDDVTGQWDVAPRLSARQALTPSFPMTTLKAGWGLYFQPPTPLDTEPRLGQSGLLSNRSMHSSAGIEQEFSRQIELSLDAFYKRFDELVVAEAQNAGSGQAYGVEWLLRYKPDGRFFGWLSYTLSRSERRDTPSEPSRLFEFDQTHILTLIGNYQFGDGWQVGGRFRVSTGDLYTTTEMGAYNATVGSHIGVSSFPPFDRRLPLFNQLDLRIEKARKLGHFRWTLFLDVQNVYVADNPLGVTYNYDYTKSMFVKGLTLLPILGVRGEYE